MGKGGRKSDNKSFKKQKTTNNNDGSHRGTMEDYDDEIDAFHKQREVVPLDIDDDIGESDDDTEHPVFEYKDVEEDDDDDVYDDAELTGLAAKISRQQKYLRAKIGGVEDEMHYEDEEEEEKRVVWGRTKNMYYNADNVDYELQSSDDELPAEEEAEVLRLQKEKAKTLSMEDFGLEDASEDESNGEPTIQDLVKGKSALKTASEKEAQDDVELTYEVEKDLTALSREEKMDVVYSSAPELVGFLSELNDSLEQLENKVNPILGMVAEVASLKTGGMNYIEVKRLLLLEYCQAITFYLLLKSEGKSVRDHPVIAHLVEIKNLLDKMKQLDDNIPFELEDMLKKKNETEKVVQPIKENASLAPSSFEKDQNISITSAKDQEEAVVNKVDKLVKADSLDGCEKKGEKHKHQDDQVGRQSMEMLKKRAELEEKLKQKGVFSSIPAKHDKPQRKQQPLSGKLATLDDYNDDTLELNEHANSLSFNKISLLVTSQTKKYKVVSGDDDLAKRDDIGERRRKHELRVLAGAGIKSVDDGAGDSVVDMDADDGSDASRSEESEMQGSEDDFYKQVGQKRAEKLAAKAEMYSRTPVEVSATPETVDGKRQISYHMEKNRGLTRARKKLTKNPRKKYKLKHQKAIVQRKGQVRDIRKPSGSYGGEVSGINAGISRSIRFKN